MPFPAPEPVLALDPPLSAPLPTTWSLGFIKLLQNRYQRVNALRKEGKFQEALEQLRLLQGDLPMIAEDLKWQEGRLLLKTEQVDQACKTLDQATANVNRDIAVQARMDHMRCLICRNPKRAREPLRKLLRIYPAYPYAGELYLKLAEQYEQEGQRDAAIKLFRQLDLFYPHHPEAAHARAVLGELEKEMVIRQMFITHKVDRAERLVRKGTIHDAKAALQHIAEHYPRLPPHLATRLAELSARMARFQGELKQAAMYLVQAKQGVWRLLETKAPDPEAEARARTRIRHMLQRMIGRPPHRRVSAIAMMRALRLASSYSMTQAANGIVKELARRRSVPAYLALRAAVRALGTADDALITSLLESLLSHRLYGRKARYYYARTLERSGHDAQALTQYNQLIEISPHEDYYAMWAKQQRQGLQGQKPATHNTKVQVKARDTHFSTRTLHPKEAKQHIDSLTPLRSRQGKLYPWLERAQAFMALGERAHAADEIHEVYLAWRDARGVPMRRMGVEAVYRGSERRRQFVSWLIRRKRRELSDTERVTLAEVATALGDTGTAVGFRGSEALAKRPRAYHAEVDKAAREFDLDPNLLLAVMRVESVYHRRIVSTVGAIGLTQIMPATGRRIANALGLDDFHTDALLDPRVNLRFSAWYLRSLLKRFEGRVPLAIASYNGGPHNVRAWIHDYGQHMPMDAFLEHIPFEQTHRYVRRVLGHYQAYRAQVSKPAYTIKLTLPTPQPDPVGF